MKSEQKNITWHTGFISAIHLELADYKEYLEFHTEYQLTTEPLKIDCVIIKKPKDLVIQKNFAMFFREINILEYKNPTDYLSVEDFYKVYAYACLYISLNKIPVNNITLSLIRSGFSEKLINHLKEIRKYTVEEKNPGIYTVSGDIFPIEIIDSKKLSPEENIWLKDLSNNLETSEWQNILNKADSRKEDRTWLNVYFDILTRANRESLREIRNMGTNAFVEVLEEIGVLDDMKARDEARIEERRNREIVQNMRKQGFTIDQIISATQLSPEKVEALIEAK